MRKWLKKQMCFYYKNSGEGGQRLYVSLGPLEIALIAIVVILIFGVGKLAGVGGALGKSIRDFRREVRDEKDKVDNTQQSTTTKSIEEKSTPPEAESKEESKD